MTYSLSQTVAATVEPTTVAEGKKHLEISENDATHDTHIRSLIEAAREQVEHDTGLVLLDQTWTLSLDKFPTGLITLPLRPVQSITSISYYDENNASQTLATSVYGLDIPRQVVYLKYDQEWPSVTEQHNGVVITVVAGYGANGGTVPRMIRQAILLQVGKWFADRDMLGVEGISRYTYDAAYERLIRRVMRSSYP